MSSMNQNPFKREIIVSLTCWTLLAFTLLLGIARPGPTHQQRTYFDVHEPSTKPLTASRKGVTKQWLARENAEPFVSLLSAARSDVSYVPQEVGNSMSGGVEERLVDVRGSSSKGASDSAENVNFAASSATYFYRRGSLSAFNAEVEKYLGKSELFRGRFAQIDLQLAPKRDFVVAGTTDGM